MKKKLIEVALPLEAINAEAAREKSIRHGHPSTLHLWWSRKPLAACRAVLFASLVDDPSSHPEQFPTQEDQDKERQRLFNMIEKLVKWENKNNEALYSEAYQEILKSTDGDPPIVLDPFAGGGSIPLEAQRLGLEAYASDLNPVAVFINKALIEIPSHFANMSPVNPDSRGKINGTTLYNGATGLAEDVAYYGGWLKQEVFKRVGHLYPKARLTSGTEATVIAWKWARTVKCPNPACGAEMPLVSSYWLSKKKGKEAWVEPIINHDSKTIEFEVKTGEGQPPQAPKVSRGARFRCSVCSELAPEQHVKGESLAGRMNAKMIAIIAAGDSGRVYLSPNKLHVSSSEVDKLEGIVEEYLALDPRAITPPQYGLTQYSDLFTPRQLNTLVTFSDLVSEVMAKVQSDASIAGLPNDDIGLDSGGKGAKAYSEAIGVYIACIVDKLVDYNSSLCSWHNSGEKMRNTFGRQALPIIWDYAEANPFSNSSGCWDNCVDWVYKCLLNATPRAAGIAIQKDAMQLDTQDSIVISTDPPYYDNVPYANISDFFYVWLRRVLQKIYPRLFSTMLVPKAEELVSAPYRFEGNLNKAKQFFEHGMYQAFTKFKPIVASGYPLTIYYAFKQSDNIKGDANNSKASSGWETMLSALINAGFTIHGTWPMRTELASRMRSIESNALASSIAIVCRPRSEDAPTISRRVFISELREALKTGLRDLQSGNIAPVDLSQAAIGPGMAVYSKYSEVLDADGTPMSVRGALILINQELDAYLTDQEGRMDTKSRFCIAWFEQFGHVSGKYGDAETMATARLANIQSLVDVGVLESGRGIVRLKRRDELPDNWDSNQEEVVWTMVQQLCHCHETLGLDHTAKHLLNLSSLDSTSIENVKALAYRAYIVAERKGWADEALAYNSLVTAWPDLIKRMNMLKDTPPEQIQLDY